MKDKEKMDYRPISSIHELSKFIDGTVYEDFKAEMNCRIEMMRTVLEVADSKSYIKTQGGIEMLRLVKNIFEDLKANKESDLREEAEEKMEDVKNG